MGEAAEEKPDDGGTRPKGTIWEAILSQAKSVMVEQVDINVIVLGGKKVGKSTLVQRFIRRDDTSQPKPTTALEYTHAKREEQKQVKMAHFWELGGGQQLAPLLDVIITPENIHTVLVVVVADLSEGRGVWSSVQFWLLRIKQRVRDCFAKLKSQPRNAYIPGKLLSRMQKRFGEKHPDIETVTIIGVPLCVVATKHDVFRDEGPEVQKTMARTLRFWAHSFAACLCYVSTKDDRDMAKYRGLLNYLVFGGLAPDKQLEFEYTKPLFILSGRDSFKEIGAAPTCARPQGFQSCGNEEFDKWKAGFETVFTAKKDKAAKDEVFDVGNPEFAEPAVDAARAVKDDELEQYRARRRKALEEQIRKEERARQAAAAEADGGGGGEEKKDEGEKKS